MKIIHDRKSKTRSQSSSARRRPGHEIPARDQSAAQGNAACGRQTADPICGRGMRRLRESTTSLSSPAAGRMPLKIISIPRLSWKVFWKAKGKSDLAKLVHDIGNMVHFSYTRQKEPLGLGHAVLVAKELVGNEPFAVLLGDVIIPGPAARHEAVDRSVRSHGQRRHRRRRSAARKDRAVRHRGRRTQQNGAGRRTSAS